MCEIRVDNNGVDITNQLLRRARPILDPTRHAMEEGISRLEPSLKALGLRRGDPWLDAHLVRSVARDRLALLAPPTGWPWAIDTTVANSGIHLTTMGTRLRVALGDVMRVPAPGHSQTRRAYWSQRATPSAVQLSLFDDEAIVDLNLLLLWKPRCDGSVALTIAVPLGVWPFHGKQRLIACVPVDDPPLDGEFDAGDDLGEDLAEGLVAEIHEEVEGEDR